MQLMVTARWVRSARAPERRVSEETSGVGRLPNKGWYISIDDVPVPVDSKVGIERLLSIARVHRFKLNPYHAQLATIYGVLSDGVMFYDEP
jgi:hypothetical protein